VEAAGLDMKIDLSPDLKRLLDTYEKEIRERIAKEIEATCECGELSSGWHCQANQMAAIARGEVKE